MKGQAISSDFIFSLIIFAIASTLAFTMITNSLIDREHEMVTAEAKNAAALLSGEGYPQHWLSGDVLRAGLRSADQLSLRKTYELGDVPQSRLQAILRTTDPIYVYATNRTNHTVPIFGRCGIGALSVSETPANRTLPAIAIVATSHPVSDIATLAQRGDDGVYANLSSQDVIIIEGNVTSNLSDAQRFIALEQTAERGITVVIIGNPGIPIFGLRVNATAITAAEVQMDLFGLNDSDLLTITGTFATIDAPSNSLVTNYTIIANASKALYATWLYNDARIWYFGTATGTKADGTPLVEVIGNATRDMIKVPWPECGNISLPDAEQIALHTRSLIYHDERLDLHVLVWREE